MIIKRLIIWSIIGTGITSVTTQLLTIREFLTQFHGNEITISLVLFCWLLLSGLGSLIARFFKNSSLALYSVLIFVIAVWPLFQIIGIRIMREAVFVHGVSPGLFSIFSYILISIAPYCLLTGFILPYALRVLNKRKLLFESGALYITDNIGDIAGGLLFSFFLVYWLKPFATILVTSSILIAVALLIFLNQKKFYFFSIALVVLLIFTYFTTSRNFELWTLTKQYGDVVNYKESPYGRIVVSREGPQKTIWESGSPIYSDMDVVNSEEKIHYPLCQLEALDNVLLLSGGIGETLNEILKYETVSIDYIELDPLLTEEAFSLGLIKKAPFLKVVNTDGRRYMATTEKKYDAIIVSLPEPDTFQLNRFFTAEFFSLAKTVLNSSGVFSISVDYSQNYISEIRRKKLSTIYNTAHTYFRNVLVIPGEKAYFICSDNELFADIPRRLKSKSIRTSYIADFFYGDISDKRIDLFNSIFNENEPVNTDFNPRLMNIVFLEWFTKHGGNPKYLVLMIAAIMIMCTVTMNKEQYVIFSTGIVTMGAEMLVIFSFQVVYGYIYREVGAIVTLFLFGLLPGAFLGNKPVSKNYRNLLISEASLVGLLAVFYIWVYGYDEAVHPVYFLIYCFVFAFICGFQFPVVAGIIGEKRNPAASLLAADLTGASIGTILTGTILIPLLGISYAVIILILVKISSGGVLLVRRGMGAE